jgi:hypothetical protein
MGLTDFQNCRAGLEKIARESAPLAARVADMYARSSPLRTLAARTVIRPNPLPSGLRVLTEIRPPAAQDMEHHRWRWLLALTLPGRRPKNLRPQTRGVLWRYEHVDDIIRLVEDLAAVVAEKERPAQVEAARKLVHRHPWWVSPWFAKPSIRCAIRRLTRAAMPEAVHFKRTPSEHIRAWLLAEVLPLALVDALTQTHDVEAVARLAKRLAGERILAAAPSTDADRPASPSARDETAAREFALLEQLLAQQAGAGDAHDAADTLSPGDQDRLEQFEGREALDMTAPLAAEGNLARFTVLERAVAEQLVQAKSVAESAALLELTVRQIYDARARVRLKVRRFGRRQRA